MICMSLWHGQGRLLRSSRGEATCRTPLQSSWLVGVRMMRLNLQWTQTNKKVCSLSPSAAVVLARQRLQPLLCALHAAGVLLLTLLHCMLLKPCLFQACLLLSLIEKHLASQVAVVFVFQSLKSCLHFTLLHSSIECAGEGLEFTEASEFARSIQLREPEEAASRPADSSHMGVEDSTGPAATAPTPHPPSASAPPHPKRNSRSK